MKIISNKSRNKWSNFLILTGILSIGLSILFVSISDSFIGEPIVKYFFINSIIVVILGILLKFKKANIYNILSIILITSVLIGWFFDSVAMAVISGFIMFTTGGPIIIPLFHIAVLGSFIATVKRLTGKTQYEYEVIVAPTNNQSVAQQVPTVRFKKTKKFLAFVITLVIVVLTSTGIYLYIKTERIGSLEIEEVRTEKEFLLNNDLLSGKSITSSGATKSDQYIIPKSAIVNKNDKEYVCLITYKKESFSMDYQYYKVRSKLKEISTDGESAFAYPEELEWRLNYGKFVYIKSGLNQGDEILMHPNDKQEQNKNCMGLF